jgi:hypothetical protein
MHSQHRAARLRRRSTRTRSTPRQRAPYPVAPSRARTLRRLRHFCPLLPLLEAWAHAYPESALHAINRMRTASLEASLETSSCPAPRRSVGAPRISAPSPTVSARRMRFVSFNHDPYLQRCLQRVPLRPCRLLRLVAHYDPSTSPTIDARTVHAPLCRHSLVAAAAPPVSRLAPHRRRSRGAGARTLEHAAHLSASRSALQFGSLPGMRKGARARSMRICAIPRTVKYLLVCTAGSLFFPSLCLRALCRPRS